MSSKTSIVLFIAAITGISGFLIKVPKTPTTQPFVPIGWIHLQKLILPLFENVCEASTNPIIVRLAQEFDVEPSSADYLYPEVIQNLKILRSKGLLAKGEIFTEYNSAHVSELRVLYEVLVHAKDFDTFYKAAAWARQNVNCGLFVDLIYLAILNRRDTEKLSVPAPYELLPNYFIRKDIIVQASTLLSENDVTSVNNINTKEDGNSYIIDANYTSTIEEYGDLKLAYFREDIGLNTFYFLEKLQMSPWFNTPPSTSIRFGEYLYHLMKQLSSRYDLERYANNLPELEDDMDLSKITPYDPMLVYSNGNEFGYRTTLGEDTSDISALYTIESNLGTVVTHMLSSGYNKTQILNHLMEILVTGQNSYESLARKLPGKAMDSCPSTLEHYVTSLRDPMFWYINKKIVSLVDNALKKFPEYKRNELFFPGVEIINIDVKKFSTSFDNFQFDVTDALKSDAIEPTFQVKIGQPRLNHKSFALKINVTSIASQKGFVKIYVGPKVAPGEYSAKKNLFMLIDKFEYNLKPGTNVISRSSEQMTNLSDNFAFLKVLRKQVEDADFGLEVIPLKPVETLTEFPNRLILPKGTPEGLPLQILVFIAPFVKASAGGIFGIASTEYNSAVLSPGYPFDLPSDTNLFVLPNTLIKDFTITHKGESTGQLDSQPGANKWQNNYDYGSKPDYSAKNKQYGKTFDYKAKINQINKDHDDIKDVETEVYESAKTISNDEIDNIIVTTDSLTIEHMDTKLDDMVTDTYRNLKLSDEPSSSRKRKATVYDYLLPKIIYDDDDDDYTDEKVYE